MNICRASHDPCQEWRHFLESYRNYAKPDAAVLEIGASSVVRTRELAQYCRTLTGVEVMPDRLPQDFGNVHYIVGDWQKLSAVVEPESIDIAVSNHVIEHVKDDVAAFRELHKVLKPGGVALINTPNRKRLARAVIEVCAGERKFPFWEHEREYVEADLVRLVENTPFVKCTIKAVVFGMTGGPLHCYINHPPPFMRRYCASWELHLQKQ